MEQKNCKRALQFLIAILFVLPSQAQTDMDAIMMNKNQFCSGLQFGVSSWKNYWEGKLKRNNENLGTVSSSSLMLMANYGITGKLNVMVGAPYIWNKASAGTLRGMQGLQDASLFVKWKALTYTKEKQKLSVFLLGGFSTPLSNYVADYLPLSIGLRSTNLTGRLMVDYQYKRFTVTGSAAFIGRSNIKIDRNAYYDTQLRLTNEVNMPNATQFQLRTGYRGKYLLAEALLTNWTTLGGFDISRNNMPFPSNRMNATSAGFNLKYTLKSYTNLSFLAGGQFTLAGRNMGQSNGFTAGAFYAFYFSKKDKK